ncbi:hypothetical protein QTG56_24810 (plasmid) [Rossellomorea sp. AcN35-11]|nr:hypothetical protein [Rossellomorea aquimaris]WJV31857.1 hypothetical protein QTG56_24810 [Rossellomorea sp. AcN35-11]
MSEFKQDILNYGDDIKDIDAELSSFEYLRMLYDRTEIENIIDKLDKEEKYHLFMYDFMMLKSIDKVYSHVSKVYDFSKSDDKNIPLNQWWWHLDKLAKGELSVAVTSEKVV